MAIKHFFRPNLLVKIPKTEFPIKPPHMDKLAIHEASSIEIFLRDGSGDSSDVSKLTLGLVQPL